MSDRAVFKFDRSYYMLSGLSNYHTFKRIRKKSVEFFCGLNELINYHSCNKLGNWCSVKGAKVITTPVWVTPMLLIL